VAGFTVRFGQKPVQRAITAPCAWARNCCRSNGRFGLERKVADREDMRRSFIKRRGRRKRIFANFGLRSLPKPLVCLTRFFNILERALNAELTKKALERLQSQRSGHLISRRVRQLNSAERFEPALESPTWELGAADIRVVEIIEDKARLRMPEVLS